ncbi:MAG: hypothetical protein KAV87_12350 [Desulfobacteraceae bacterium]|nr:hypothetical protein [Desulfobacteraceae bacterium]
MEEMIVDGIPVLIKERGRPPRSIRVKMKKSGPKEVKYKPFSKLDSRQKQALTNYADLGCDLKKKREAAEAAGYSDKHQVAVRAMDRLLARQPIVKKIEEECQALYEKGKDAKVAQVLAEQLEAVHPLAKGEKKDNLAILGAAKEINKLSDNYPAKKVDVREVGFYVHFTGDDVTAAKEYRKLTDEDS